MYEIKYDEIVVNKIFNLLVNTKMEENRKMTDDEFIKVCLDSYNKYMIKN